jgi:chromosome segregation ATPase
MSLIERLRHDRHDPLRKEAADEIERLTAELKECQNQYLGLASMYEAMQKERDELKAELAEANARINVWIDAADEKNRKIVALNEELKEAEREQGFCFACNTELNKAQSEPVAWMRPSEEGYDSAFRDHSTVMLCTGNDWGGWIPLYAHPAPADKDAERYRSLRNYQHDIPGYVLSAVEEGGEAMDEVIDEWMESLALKAAMKEGK